MSSRAKGHPMKSIRTSVSLPEQQHQLLQQVAQTSNLSIAWLIRQAVTEFLAHHGEKHFEPLSVARPVVEGVVKGAKGGETQNE
jgi:predicted DNA-binding ribbon-helix-helix protein